MTEYEIFYTVRTRLERVWKDAERSARWLAATGHYAADDETELSRKAGGRA